MKNVIIHIPHSSENIPEIFSNDFYLNKIELNNELNIMTDKFTYDLVKDFDFNIINFDYSRLICDVERFNDENEIMNSLGMGVFYTKTHNNKILKKINNIEFVNKIYNEHHNKLTNLVDELLITNDKVYIFDIHSYSDNILEYELNKTLNRPDICIGFNEFHMNDTILNKIKEVLNTMDYSYDFNVPFEGSIVPLKHLNKNNKVISIMLEINKRLYLKNNVLTNNFEILKRNILYIIEKIING